MERFPDGARFDVLRLEQAADRLAVGAEVRGVDGDAGEPACVAPPGGLGHEVDSGHAPQPLGVVVKVAPARLDAFLEHLELAPPNRRENVAHAVVVANFRVLVVRGLVTRLCGELARVRH